MFYTMLQEYDWNGVWRGERFICFEANSMEEANERAEWYGIDMAEMIEDRRHPALRWSWYLESCGKPTAQIARYEIAEARRNGIEGDWIIVYLNGNLKSSLAIPFEDEPDPYAVEVVNTASTYIFDSYMPYTSRTY
jgi:hypothetical protein